MATDPIKRHLALQPVSREHHHSLLLCWKIRTGINKSIEGDRIMNYAEWFYNTHLKEHFEEEEKYIFPILGNKHDLVKRALAEHRKLHRLFMKSSDVLKSLTQIEETLENHIRFEERILFNKVQEVASEKELSVLLSIHSTQKEWPEWHDCFWE